LARFDLALARAVSDRIVTLTVKKHDIKIAAYGPTTPLTKFANDGFLVFFKKEYNRRCVLFHSRYWYSSSPASYMNGWNSIADSQETRHQDCRLWSDYASHQVCQRRVPRRARQGRGQSPRRELFLHAELLARSRDDDRAALSCEAEQDLIKIAAYGPTTPLTKFANDGFLAALDKAAQGLAALPA
jgi:hypothetical protein